jgi:DNA modification methylase
VTIDLRHGDCLAIMRDIPDASVDAVVTDPPYMVGAISVGNARAKAGTWADMENSAYWFSAWMKECKRTLKPTGHLLCFGNWRSIPTLIRALSLCDMPSTSCLVWDKQWIGLAGPQQLRGRYEIVMFSAMPEARIDDRAAPDIENQKWQAGSMRETKHPAEKPVPLLQRLCRLVTPPGGTVLDPFAGSGSTGKAAALEGFRFIGIEREAEYVEIARARIAAAVARAGLSERTAS